MKTWIKLYTEILSDPKMGRMSDKLFRRTIELFLIAGKDDRGGRLPEIDDIAWSLHISRNEVKSTLAELVRLNIVSVQTDPMMVVLGNSDSKYYTITHFSDRQKSEQTKSESNRAYYEKQKNKRSEIQTELQNEHDTESKTEIQTEYKTEIQTEIQTEKNKNSENSDTECKSEIQYVEEEVEEEVEEDKEVNKLCAEAQKGKTSNPDDPAFWQRTFGPRAEMAHAFHMAAGITPIRSEFGRWQNDLKNLQEAGITISEMESAVRQMRAENLTIKAPGSILAMARKLKTNPQTEKPQKRTYSFTEVGEMMKRGELVI